MDNRKFSERMKNEILKRERDESWDRSIATRILKKRSDNRKILFSGVFALVLLAFVSVGFFSSTSKDITSFFESDEYNFFHEVIVEDSVDRFLNVEEIVQN